MLQVPEDILEKTQQIATGKKISPEAHVDLIAAVITASVGDVNDFTFSRRTGYRSRQKVANILTQRLKVSSVIFVRTGLRR